VNTAGDHPDRGVCVSGAKKLLKQQAG